MTAIWELPAQPMIDVPVIRVHGSARERGRQYGEQARERIHRSRREYDAVYTHFATWDWDRVRAEAKAFIAPITAFDARYVDEMHGIAEGSGLDFLDILAMNLRTEILFAAKARSANATLPPIAECTSFSAVTDRGQRIVGQNWDWLTFSSDTIVMIEATPDEGPSWMTIVEAGLLAKFGMNSAGLALATNALVSAADTGKPGVPYHVMLRALLDCTSATDAAIVLQRADRASSANYLFATADGLAVDAETRPGGFDMITWTDPDDAGTLLHANHFSQGPRAATGVIDVGLKVMPDSIFRLQRARTIAAINRAESDLDAWKTLLSDHAGYPDSICTHPNDQTHPMDQWKTVVGIVFEPDALRAHISIGTPCTAVWQVRDYRPGQV